MSSRFTALLSTSATALLLLAGCGGGEATKTTCPTDSTLTYQNFGQSFMSVYCLRCHNTALKGSARHDAPDDVNFDTIDGIHAESIDIDKQAGAGATVTNEEMPPDGEKPTVDDRKRLAEWLACGAP